VIFFAYSPGTAELDHPNRAFRVVTLACIWMACFAALLELAHCAPVVEEQDAGPD